MSQGEGEGLQQSKDNLFKAISKHKALVVNKIDLSVCRIATFSLNCSSVIMETAGPRFARTATARVHKTKNATVKCAISASLI